MMTIPTLATLLSLTLPLPAEPPTAAATEYAPLATSTVVTVQDPTCAVNPNMDLEGRASPLDSTSVSLADGTVKLCYGAPSARDRTMIGGEAVPFGSIWRTGANEATVLHTTVALSLGGLALEPGSYALYTIPGETEWELFVTRSTDHWGMQITDEVRAQEVGSVQLSSERIEDHVETLDFSFEDAGSRSASLVMEWEHTRLTIPVTATGS